MINNEILIKKHGKSFYWASKFLDKKFVDPIYKVYEICRIIDDIVDKQESSKAIKDLQLIKNNKSSLKIKNKINKKYLSEFIKGQESDLKFRQPETIDELIQYCYRVAGVVGLMVCDAVNIKDNNLKFFAIDLGIAMQLVNIIRDIKEDAENKRVYLPITLIGKTSHLEVINNSKVVENINIEKIKILNIADKYFKSANYAIQFLPKEVSKAFGLASRIYDGIGRKIIKQEHNYTHGRVYLNNFEKFIYTLKYLIKLKGKPTKNLIHNAQLHFPILGLPNTNG